MPGNQDGVTLTANALGDATFQGPGDVPTSSFEGFIGAYGGGTHRNWTISNLEILDFDWSVGLFCCGSGSSSNQYDSLTITNNRIRIPADLNATVAPADNFQNVAIHLAWGKNQTISNNLIQIPGNGVSDTPGGSSASSVALQSNTHGGSTYDGLLIDGNVIQVLNAPSADPERIRGIWENGHSHTSGITVSNNQFVNLAPGNNRELNKQQAFWVTSHSSASTTVSYSGNTVSGANIGIKWLGAPEYPSNFSGNLPVQVTGNTLTDCSVGLLVQSNGAATVTANTITGGGVGVGILAGSSAALTCNEVTNNVTGIDTDAGSPAVTAASNAIAGNSLYGMDALGAAATVVAENNWWGCPAGPPNAGCDPVVGNFDVVPASAIPNVCVDTDGDGVSDSIDNCPFLANPLQENADADALGDACDACTDVDGDGFGNPGFPLNSCAVDNCPAVVNPSQVDTDSDGTGDVCDACTDTDGDGFGDPGFPANVCGVDNCPAVSNPGQSDVDGDQFGDACDSNTGLLTVSVARLQYDYSLTKDRGSFKLRALVDDNDTGGTLQGKLLAGLVAVRVRDAGAFDATATLTGCQANSRGSVKCRSSNRLVKAKFTPTNQGPLVYNFTLTVKGLGDTVTGAVQPIGPASITFTQDTIARADSIGDVTACKPSGSKALTCVER